MKSRGLRAGVVGLVLLLAIGVAPPALAEPVPVEDVSTAGTDGAGDGAELPPTAEGAAQPPVPPVIDTAVEPPVGSPQRAALDEIRAARDAEREQVETASEPSVVEPAEVEVAVDVLLPPEVPAGEPSGNPSAPGSPAPGESPGADPGPGPGESSPGSTPGSAPAEPPAPGGDGPTPAPEPTPTPAPEPTPDEVQATPAAAGAPVMRPASFASGGGDHNFRRVAQSAMSRRAQPSDVCETIPGEPWSATYQRGGVVVTPRANAAGSVRVIVTNNGTQAWPDGGRTLLSYTLFDSNNNPVAVQAPQTVVPATAPNTYREVVAAVGPLTPGTWKLVWDVWVEGVGWFADRNVCAGTIEYVIPHQPPNLTLGQPHHRSTVTTRTPTLFVTGSDLDEWPSNLSYQFVLCRDAAMTARCVQSGYRFNAAFVVPRDFVEWNGTFWWTARVTDGHTVTDAVQRGVPPHEVTVEVPAPQPWRTVGAGLGVATVHGMLLPHDIWVHHEQDAALPGTGLPLQIQRTYSSAAATTRGAFGLGWLSMFDAEVQRAAGPDLLIVTYPDARQEVFGRQSDGSLVSRADSGVTNRVEEVWDGSVKVRTAGQEVLTYRPDGRLVSVARTGQGELQLVRDAGGQVTQLVQQPSGRKLTLSWTTPSCLKAPVVSRVATDAPAAGAQPLVWTYGYRCDGQLERVCNPTGACTTYGTATEQRFSTSAAGRTRYRPQFGSWYPSSRGDWDHRVVSHRTDDGRPLFFDYFKPQPDYIRDYTATVNSFGGIAVEVQVDGYAGQGSGQLKPEVDTYLFDQGRRLRTLAHRGVYHPPSYNERNWTYSTVNGRLTAFSDENLNTMSMFYEGGNWAGRYVYRDAYSEVTLTNKFGDVDPGAAVDLRATGREVSPNPGNGSRTATFGYDGAGRLTSRTGGAVPEAPQGVTTTYFYTPPGLASGEPAGLLEAVAVGGARTFFAYSLGGDVTRSVDPAGLRIENVDDALGRRIAEITFSDAFPQGLRTEFRLDGMSRVTEVVHPRSRNRVTGVEFQRRVCHFYDPDGLLIRTVETVGSCATPTQPPGPPDRVTLFSYNDDLVASPRSVTDAGGGVTRYHHRRDFQLAPGGEFFRRGVEITDPRGSRKTMIYNSDDRLVAVVEEAADGGGRRFAARYTYDNAGRMLAEQDALGRITRYDWTDDDLQRRAYRVGVTQPDGSVRDVELWRREFDGEGRVTAEVRGGSRRTTMRYDGDGKLVEEVLDPGGLALTRSLGYTIEGHVNRETRSGSGGGPTETRYVRDSAGRALQVVVENGDVDLVVHSTYDQRGLRLSAVDPRAAGPSDLLLTTRSDYDEFGRLVGETGPPGMVEGVLADGSPAPPRNRRLTTTHGYNAFGELTHVRDAAGQVTETEYDNAGRPVRLRAPSFTNPGTTEAITPVTTWQYNPAGELLSETDPAGGVTDYRYHWTGKLAEVSGPAVNGIRPVTRLSYNDADEVVSRTDPTGAVVEYSYDRLGRQVATTEIVRQPGGAPVRLVTTVTYNDVGDVVSEQNAAGNTTRFVRDTAGRVVEVWPPGAARPTSYTYFPDGAVSRETGPSGRSTVYERDLAGRVVQVRHLDSAGAVIDSSRSTYDAAGNVVETVSPLGHRTTYTYDLLSRPLSITQFPTADAGITTTAGYDWVGNLARVTDGNGNATLTSFTPDGQPQRVIEPATATFTALADRERITHYDARGLPVAELLPGGVARRNTFDALGRLTVTTGTTPDTAAATSQYGYDLADRLTSVNHPSGTQTFTWSDRGMLTGSSGPAGEASFSYDGVGLMTARTDAAGTATFGYRGDGEMVTATEAHTGQRRYYYHDSQSAELVAEVTVDGWRTDWGRDRAGRINSVRTSDPSGGVRNAISMAYDLDGNVVSRTDGGATGGGGTFAYDGAGRMTGWTGQDGVVRRFAWDGAGNRLSESMVGADGSETPQRRWSYDARNQLVEQYTRPVSGEADLRTTFTYDARGAMRSRVGPLPWYDQGGVVTRQVRFDGLDRMVRDDYRTYSYDGLGRVAHTDGPSGSGGATPMGYAGLESGPTRDGVVTFARDTGGDVRSARHRTNAPAAAVGDVRGDVVGWRPMTTTADPPRSFLGAIGFSPFGERRSQTGEQYPIEYQGEWTDPKNGQVKMGARWYDPYLAAFTSRDPYDQGLGPPTMLNRHAYAAANPLKYVDPTGMIPILIPIVFGVWAVYDAVNEYQSCMDDRDRDRSRGRGKPVFSVPRKPSKSPAGLAANLGAQAACSFSRHEDDYEQEPSYHVRRTPHVTDLRPPVDPPQPRQRDPRNPTTVTPRKPSPPPPVVTSVQVETRSAGSVDRSSVSVGGGGGVRTKQWDYYTDQYAQARTHTYWSNGRHEWTGWSPPYLDRTDHSFEWYWVLTRDPARVLGRDVGSVAPGTGWADDLSAPAHDFGQCGLSGTVQSCLDEIRLPVLGGGCAGLRTTMQACVPTEPDPGLPAGQRENTSTVQLPSSGRVSPFSCAANSFTPGTLVVMADGTRRPIAQVRVGDEVLATDPITGRTEARPVTALITGDGVKDLVEVTVDTDGPAGSATGAVVATDGHPFWVDDRGRWIDAGDLRPGDDVVSVDGEARDVAGVRGFRAVGRVHNLTVDGIHTYYVVPRAADGTTTGPGVLAHNANKPCNLPAWKSVDIDIDHIASGHMKGGARTTGGNKDLFPDSMSSSQIEKAVRNAYKNGSRVRTQDERVLVRGQDGRLTIEMWVNTKTRQIETAYPVNR